jgi:hypothetical protein
VQGQHERPGRRRISPKQKRLVIAGGVAILIMWAFFDAFEKQLR